MTTIELLINASLETSAGGLLARVARAAAKTAKPASRTHPQLDVRDYSTVVVEDREVAVGRCGSGSWAP